MRRARCLLRLVLVWPALACDGRQRTAEPSLSAGSRASQYRSATGTLVGYDVPTRRLALRAADGLTAFWVAEDARVWRGQSRRPVAELAESVGAQVTVAFTEAEDGALTTHTVRLSEEPGAPTREGR